MNVSIKMTVLIGGCFLLAGCAAHYLPPIPTGDVGRQTGLAFLVGDRVEQKDYGLYSYVLFGSPPSDIDRLRYRTFIDACLTTIPSIEGLEAKYPRSELHISYVPVGQRPPTEIARPKSTPSEQRDSR